MKSIVLSSVVVAMLVFSGCADKKPAVDTANQEEVVQEVIVVETETIAPENVAVIEEEMAIVGDSTEMKMAKLERDLETIQFDFDRFTIRDDMQDNLSQDAYIVNGAAKAFTVKLEGNCDEWGSDEYNFALGLKRASTVKKALVAEGVNANRITMVSYGESNPVCSAKTQNCWAQNRRVDFKLLP